MSLSCVVYCQIHGLQGDELQKRNVTVIDIANDPVSSKVSGKLKL